MENYAFWKLIKFQTDCFSYYLEHLEMCINNQTFTDLSKLATLDVEGNTIWGIMNKKSLSLLTYSHD